VCRCFPDGAGPVPHFEHWSWRRRDLCAVPRTGKDDAAGFSIVWRIEAGGNSDHFSARLEPERDPGRPNNRAMRLRARHLLSKYRKNGVAREQYGVVVAPSQLEAIEPPALPRSNQTDATLFDKGHSDTNGE
jgi:hypothetical protein